MLGTGNVLDSTALISYVLSGVDTSNVLDAAATIASGVAAAVPDSPSITTVTDGAWVFSIAGTNAHDTTVTGPGGYSTAVSASSNDDNDLATHSAYLEIATAAAEDPGAYSFIARDDWDAVTVALRPGGGSGAVAIDANSWKTYIPVSTVTGRSGRWKNGPDGFIPIVDKT
jgi:hypothetical protein